MQKGHLFRVHSVNIPMWPKLARSLLELFRPLSFEAGCDPEQTALGRSNTLEDSEVYPEADWLRVTATSNETRMHRFSRGLLFTRAGRKSNLSFQIHSMLISRPFLYILFLYVHAGAFLLTEVAVRRYCGFKPSRLRKFGLLFLFMTNGVMWVHGIGDGVCRSEVDNAAIIGQQLWSFLDPVFGSAVVFFRILSMCLYFSLAFSSSEERHDPGTGSIYYLRWSCIDCEEVKSLKTGNRRLLDSIMDNNGQKVNVEQKMKLYHDHDFTYCYYSALDDRHQRNVVRSLYGALLGIPIVTTPFVAYDVLIRNAGKAQDSHKKFGVEIATNTSLIIILIVLIVSACAASERCCCSKKCLKQAVTNVEAWVFGIFTVTEVVFYGLLVGVQDGGDLAAHVLGLFTVVLHAVFIFFTNFSGHHLELFWRGVHMHTRISVCLSLLFALTLGSLAVDIEREHHDHDVHDKPYLRAFAPLIVDFRVHAAILTYNVLSEFRSHRTSKEELKKGFEEISQAPNLGSQNPTLGSQNTTLGSANSTLGFQNTTLGSANPTPSSQNPTLGSENPTLGSENPTPGSANPTPGAANPTLCSMPCCHRKKSKGSSKQTGNANDGENGGAGRETGQAKDPVNDSRETASWKCKGCKPKVHYYCDKCFMDFVIKFGECPAKFLVENNEPLET